MSGFEVSEKLTQEINQHLQEFSSITVDDLLRTTELGTAGSFNEVKRELEYLHSAALQVSRLDMQDLLNSELSVSTGILSKFIAAARKCRDFDPAGGRSVLVWHIPVTRTVCHCCPVSTCSTYCLPRNGTAVQ